MMKRLLSTLILLGSMVGSVSADERSGVLDALSAELARNQAGLKLDNYQIPYFISFRLIESTTIDVESEFGAIVEDHREHSRKAAVDVRVGDYRFDSSPEAGDIDDDLMADYRPSNVAPVDDDTLALRATFWALSDRAYKDALSRFLRKKARAVTKVKKTPVDSFSRAPKVNHRGPALTIEVNRTEWRARAARISARFRAMPELLSARVTFSVRKVRSYLANTEGSRIVTDRVIYLIAMDATTRAVDGLLLEQGRTFYGRLPEHLPADQALDTAADQIMAELNRLRVAPVIEPFTGPAILEAEAAGVFFHETIGHRLEGERQNDEEEGQTFSGQIGRSILPPFISLRDDPTQVAVGDIFLNGHYTHDDQGVKAQNVLLIDGGVLKTFLTSRTPIEKVAHSNGHGRTQGVRRPMARMGNLIVEGHRPVSRAELKAMLLEEARRQGKPYGLIIADITGGSTNTSNYGYQAFKGTPRMVYRVDAKTGEETLVRGVEMVGTPLTALNKVMATSRAQGVFNGYCGAESGYVPVSAVAPAMLFREIELQRTKGQKRKSPLLGPPWTPSKSK
ncbi:MAG: metallopeptidase TldD-related protein [Myxococcota bacterium]|nr:metallopeptidase TldD-related protein [Myxococcota bacterium]